jgi:hypothetical protein
MTLFLATLAVFLIGFTLLGIRVLLVPGSEFRKSCSGDVLKHEGGICSHCGRTDESPCDSHKRRLREAKERVTTESIEKTS